MRIQYEVVNNIILFEINDLLAHAKLSLREVLSIKIDATFITWNMEHGRFGNQPNLHEDALLLIFFGLLFFVLFTARLFTACLFRFPLIILSNLHSLFHFHTSL